MTMDLLRREQAPLLDAAWKLVDDEAARVLRLHLAGRKVVDLEGPFGWDHASVNTGRVELVSDTGATVRVGLRLTHPILELHAPARMSLRELEAVGRGAGDPDLDPIRLAAEHLARTEDHVIFNGHARAGTQGILGASPHPHLTVGSPADYPGVVVAALERLRQSGIAGPYALVVGPRPYDEIFSARPDGYPVAKQLQNQILDGPIVHASAIEGAAVISLRGGDYTLSVGHDLAVGFVQHTGDDVDLFVTESFGFRVLEPAAAVVIDRK